MALWDKSEDEVETIIDQYLENAQKQFGIEPDLMRVFDSVKEILGKKIHDFTESTFNDQTAPTLLMVLGKLKERIESPKPKPSIITSASAAEATAVVKTFETINGNFDPTSGNQSKRKRKK